VQGRGLYSGIQVQTSPRSAENVNRTRPAGIADDKLDNLNAQAVHGFERGAQTSLRNW